MELWRNSSTTATKPAISVVPVSSSGRSPKMKFRMSRIVWWRLSIARSTRRSASSGSSCASSGTSSSDSPTAYRLWMIPSCRSLLIRSRSSTTASRRTCSWSRAFSIAIPAWTANVSTSAWSSSENSSASALFVR